MAEIPLPVPRPRPAVPVLIANIRAALRGVEPGWYTSADLLPRYNAWATSQGAPSVTIKALGEGIRRGLRPESRFTHGHVRVWNLTPEMVS